MLYQLNYIHHKTLARLKFVRSADVPVARSPDKVPSEEDKLQAQPDSRKRQKPSILQTVLTLEWKLWHA